MPRPLLLPLTMMLLIAIAIAMLASAMLLPVSDAIESPIGDGTLGATEVVERFYVAVNEAIVTGSVEALEQIVHPSFADEDPLPGVEPGRAGLAVYLVSLHDTDPELQVKAEVISASANLVVTRVQVQRDDADMRAATLGEAQAVWSPIEVFRVADDVIVRRWSQTDGLILARPLAEQHLTLPGPPPRAVSLLRVTQASGTRWDALPADGPRLLVLEQGVLDVVAVSDSQAGKPRGDSRANASQRVVLPAGKSWLVPDGAVMSTTNVGSMDARLLVVTFPEARIPNAPAPFPNGTVPYKVSLPSGITAQALAGDVATTLGAGLVTVSLKQYTFAPDADLTLWGTEGPILVAVENGQLAAVASDTAWVRWSRAEMSVASRSAVLIPDNGMLVQPGGVLALRNREPYSAHALVVTISAR